MKSKVAVIKTSPQKVLADIERLVRMAGIEEALPRDKPVILKDNISWHLPLPGANTTPWQLEGVIKALKNLGYPALSAVHNNTVVTDPFKGSRLNRLDGVYKKHDIPRLYNFQDEDIRWIPYQPKAKMLVLDKIYPNGIMIPEYFIGKSIIHLPTVKCHIYTTTTGAMKNAFGGLLSTRRHYMHSVIHEALVDLLNIQKEIHTGIFAVMDGTICGNGPGPRTMALAEKDYILAGADSVAIDAVAAKIMGFDPMGIKYLRLAHEAGLGTASLSEIEIVGDDISGLNFCFSVGKNLAGYCGGALWFGPLRVFQKLFFRTSLVYLFVFASYFYHDKLWWPFKGKKIRQHIMETSKWGKLFGQYD
ncbi:MAG: DUF362 domain-containing protein [Planctomycetes bacterium]|nr:DUF362 domain-containing protein [Planctomycetota bacterium]